MSLLRIDSLPVEVLHRICEHLDKVFEFALASKHCFAVAKATLFSDIRIHYSNPDTLREDVEEWIMWLKKTNNFQYVRSLHFTTTPQNYLWWEDDFKVTDEDLSHRWQGYDNVIEVALGDRHDQEWRPAADLIHLLPGLEEVHYSCAPQIAPCVLEAVETRKSCKLSLNSFVLKSLWQLQGQKVNLSTYEEKLVTSPSLHSIVSNKFRYLDEFGKENLVEEAAFVLASGLAPKLKKISLRLLRSVWYMRPSTALRASGISRTKWPGTKPGSKPHFGKKGSLEYLELVGDELCDLKKLQQWAEVTDFSKLTTLKLRGHITHEALWWLASQTNLKLLQTLILQAYLEVDPGFEEQRDRETESEKLERRLILFFKSLPKLRSLRLLGYSNIDVIGRVLQCHSTTLQKLAVFANPMIYGITKQWNFTALKELAIPMTRSGGDADEVRWYRWIGQNFPDLRRLFLLVDCSRSALLDPDRSIDHVDKSIAHLLCLQGPGVVADAQSVMRNYAIDTVLIKSIFRMISSAKQSDASRLERLEYQIKDADETDFPKDFLALCRLVLSRHWVCSLDPRDDQRCRLITKEKHVLSRKKYQLGTRIGEQTMAIFHSLWPAQPGEDWREIWHSFPLTTDENDFQWDRSQRIFSGLLGPDQYESDIDY